MSVDSTSEGPDGSCQAYVLKEARVEAYHAAQLQTLCL